MQPQQYLFLGFLSQNLQTRMSKRCLFLSLWLQRESWWEGRGEYKTPTQGVKYHMQGVVLLLNAMV